MIGRDVNASRRCKLDGRSFRLSCKFSSTGEKAHDEALGATSSWSTWVNRTCGTCLLQNEAIEVGYSLHELKACNSHDLGIERSKNQLQTHSILEKKVRTLTEE